METTKMSSKGQVIIPKPIRKAYGWDIGQELVVIDMGDGIMIKSISPFDTTELISVAACLNYTGPAKTLEDMEAAIQQGVKERLHGID